MTANTVPSLNITAEMVQFLVDEEGSKIATVAEVGSSHLTLAFRDGVQLKLQDGKGIAKKDIKKFDVGDKISFIGTNASSYTKFVKPKTVVPRAFSGAGSMKALPR